MKKKIVHITTVHPPFDTRIFYKECKSLADLEYEVYLIHPDTPDFDENKFNENNIISVRLPKPKTRIHRIVNTMSLALKRALEIDADIYHFHDPELLLISNKLIKTGAKVIYDMHEDNYTSIVEKKYIPYPFNKLIATFFKSYEKYKMKKLDVVIAEKYYKEINNNSITVLNYPLLEKKQGIAYNHNSKNVIYTGNVTEVRGALIHAALPNFVEDLKVYFIGRCNLELSQRMKKISKDESKLIFRGINKYIPREEIDEFYSSEKYLAGIAIFPPNPHYLRKELTKFFEYMNAGLPIIVSNFECWSKFVEKYKCGLVVNPYEPDSIKKAIKFLRENPEEGKRMADNGQKAVRETLNWENEIKKLINLYEK